MPKCSVPNLFLCVGPTERVKRVEANPNRIRRFVGAEEWRTRWKEGTRRMVDVQSAGLLGLRSGEPGGRKGQDGW